MADQTLSREDVKPNAAAISSSKSKDLTWRDYDPEGGFPLPEGDLESKRIAKIFNQDMDVEMGNWILRLMNYRRQSGSLIESGVDFPTGHGISKDDALKALSYLRETQPDFDENQAGAVWADNQIEELREEFVERAEGIGIYKKTDGEKGQGSVDYGDSVLVRTKRENQARYQEELRVKAEKKDKEEAEALEKARTEGREETYLQEKAERDVKAEAEASKEFGVGQPVQKAWLQPVERKAWVKYYEERATIVKDTVVPQMSTLARLGPSAFVVLAVLGFCYYLHENYAPPSRSARIFPDVPPAVSTLAGIVALNVAVTIGYRFPPFWRFFNRWFVSVPGYPVPASIVLSMFTHTAFTHLFFNMVVLCTLGRIRKSYSTVPSCLIH